MLLPRQYQAENLEDLAENSDKTKTPFYQITKYLFQFLQRRVSRIIFF
jgi:pyrroloquinoline quinone (PQQ) biosynthesis protein C